MIEQRHEIAIGARIENDEAGIDRNEIAVQRHIDRIAVTAQLAGRLEHGHVVPPAEQPSSRQPGHSRADHRDPEPGDRRSIHGDVP